MSKAFIYGDFINVSANRSRNIEIGKPADSSGDTWAKNPKFKTSIDLDEHDDNYDYRYDNAPYFFVKGEYRSNGRLTLYPGATLKTLGNCYVASYIQLAHDANLYSGGNISATTGYIDTQSHSDLFAKGDIKAGRYISLGDNTTYYCGKSTRATSSFEADTKSVVFVQGDLKALLSTIKIRDSSTVFCGGSMTALRYVELGKFDEKYVDSREGLTNCNCEYKCQSAEDADGDHQDLSLIVRTITQSVRLRLSVPVLLLVLTRRPEILLVLYVTKTLRNVSIRENVPVPQHALRTA